MMDLCPTQSKLMQTLGTARAPFLVDVCLPEDVADDPYRLPCAVPARHTDAEHLARTLPARPVVVVSQKGLKLSQGVTAVLRARGIDAQALHGGNLGWRDAGLPRLDLGRCPSPTTPCVLGVPMTPVALVHAWLFRRWCSPDAPIYWVPDGSAQDVADRFNAVVPTPEPVAWADSLGLDDAQLISFLHEAPHAQRHLLAALPCLHPTENDVTRAALLLLDAAWTAHKGCPQ